MGEHERVHEGAHVAFVITITEERGAAEVEASRELAVFGRECRDDSWPRSIVPDREERGPRRSLLKPDVFVLADPLQCLEKAYRGGTVCRRRLHDHDADADVPYQPNGCRV